MLKIVEIYPIPVQEFTASNRIGEMIVDAKIDLLPDAQFDQIVAGFAPENTRQSSFVGQRIGWEFAFSINFSVVLNAIPVLGRIFQNHPVGKSLVVCNLPRSSVLFIGTLG